MSRGGVPQGPLNSMGGQQIPYGGQQFPYGNAHQQRPTNAN